MASPEYIPSDLSVYIAKAIERRRGISWQRVILESEDFAAAFLAAMEWISEHPRPTPEGSTREIWNAISPGSFNDPVPPQAKNSEMVERDAALKE
jgi:hypothetical protein